MGTVSLTRKIAIFPFSLATALARGFEKPIPKKDIRSAFEEECQRQGLNPVEIEFNPILGNLSNTDFGGATRINKDGKFEVTLLPIYGDIDCPWLNGSHYSSIALCHEVRHVAKKHEAYRGFLDFMKKEVPTHLFSIYRGLFPRELSN